MPVKRIIYLSIDRRAAMNATAERLMDFAEAHMRNVGQALTQLHRGYR
jgi:hypothetical protein